MVEVEDKRDLTDNELILYFLQSESEERMQGTIRAKGCCPLCLNKFVEVKRLGYICSEHKTVPKRLYVDLFYKGQRIRLFSDKQGQPIDTYQRATELLNHINYELKNYLFDPTKYVKQQVELFYIGNLLERFLKDKIETLAPSYKRDYVRYVRIAKSFFLVKDVRELRKLDIINYKEYLERDFSFSGKTVKNIFDNFKTFLRYLRDDIEVVDRIPSFPVVETTQPETNWLTSEVQKKVVACLSIEDKPIIEFLMLHGCRPGESMALKCKDIDLEKKIIVISATFSDSVYREKRKGRNSKSVVIPIHPESLGYLKSRVENNLPGAFVFINSKTGGNYTGKKLREIWKRARVELGLSSSIRLYDATRHSVASQLINKGVPIKSVSRLLGHTNVRTTERYAHVDLERLKIDMKNISLKGKTVTKLSPAKKSAL